MREEIKGNSVNCATESSSLVSFGLTSVQGEEEKDEEEAKEKGEDEGEG